MIKGQLNKKDPDAGKFLVFILTKFHAGIVCSLEENLALHCESVESMVFLE